MATMDRLTMQQINKNDLNIVRIELWIVSPPLGFADPQEKGSWEDFKGQMVETEVLFKVQNKSYDMNVIKVLDDRFNKVW